MPKSFLAVNLSDAFTFQEKERQNSEGDVLEMKTVEHAVASASGESELVPVVNPVATKPEPVAEGAATAASTTLAVDPVAGQAVPEPKE